MHRLLHDDFAGVTTKRNLHDEAASVTSPAKRKLEVRSTKKPRIEKPKIGWREWVTFPDFDGVRVKAKIDTGARTSALHASNIEIFVKNGESLVRFELHPEQRNISYTVQCVAPLVAHRSVKSSSGQTEERHFISTVIRLGGQTWPIELSLTRRDQMGFRMLLGRHALRGRYLIDPGRSFMLGR